MSDVNNTSFNVFKEKCKSYCDRVLALGNDSLEKTIVVALALCFVCAILVSIAAVALRPLQLHNKALDRKKNILEVAGLMQENTDIDQAFSKLIEAKIVNIATGDYVSNIDIAHYDQRKAAKDPKQSISIPKAQDIAGIKRKAKNAKVYLVKVDAQIKSIILPIHGYGLWSTMYGFIAVAADGQTVQSINFYDQAETPGLGGEIVNSDWRALWKGKKIYNQAGVPILKLIKGSVDPADPNATQKVDGLAGATLTSFGVTSLIRYWLGKEGFALYLAKVRVASNGGS